jgi:hypothetical protein
MSVSLDDLGDPVADELVVGDSHALAAALPARPPDPARVRRGFRNIRQALPDLASAPKLANPAPAARLDTRTAAPATTRENRQAIPAREGNPQAEGLSNELSWKREISEERGGVHASEDQPARVPGY